MTVRVNLLTSLAWGFAPPYPHRLVDNRELLALRTSGHRASSATSSKPCTDLNRSSQPCMPPYSPMVQFGHRKDGRSSQVPDRTPENQSPTLTRRGTCNRRNRGRDSHPACPINIKSKNAGKFKVRGWLVVVNGEQQWKRDAHGTVETDHATSGIDVDIGRHFDHASLREFFVGLSYNF